MYMPAVETTMVRKAVVRSFRLKGGSFQPQSIRKRTKSAVDAIMQCVSD